jgi:mannose/fructose-specific phosphotransferase system component IIA
MPWRRFKSIWKKIMSDEVRGILVGHGKLAEGLLDAIEEITGSREGLVPLDNQGLTPEGLEQRLLDVAGGGPSVVFVDLPSGSCAFAARRLKVRSPRMAVVCGVNLPLLLDFVFHRSLPLEEIIERLRTRVGVTIEQPADGDSSVPG